MSDLDTLLAPLLDSAPDPAPIAAVSARASRIRRRRRVRVTALVALVVVVAAGGIVAALPRDDHGVSTIGPAPDTHAAPGLKVGSPRTLPHAGLDAIVAFGSIWVAEPTQVVRLDVTSGRVVATIRVPSTEFRKLAAGAGSIWVDDSTKEVVTRIDATTNRVRATIPLPDPVYVTDGFAFLDGRLWIARPLPKDDGRNDLITIDPATDRITHRTRISRTYRVLAGTDALWYVTERPYSTMYSLADQLVRVDPRTLRAKVVRRNVTAILAISDGEMWLQTAAGVIEVDEQTGAQVGRTIPLGPVVNAAAGVGGGALWLAVQLGTSTPGALTAYDVVTHRAVSKPVLVGLPVVNVVTSTGAVWVTAYMLDGLARIPFSRG